MEDIFFEKLKLLRDNYDLDWEEHLYDLYEFTKGTTLLEDNILKILEVFDEILEGCYSDWPYVMREYIPDDVPYDEVKPFLDGEIQDLFVHFFKCLFGKGIFYERSPDSSLNVHFPKILKWFEDLVKFWDMGMQPYPFTSFIESLKVIEILKKNFLLILKWFEGQDFENIYEPFKKLIENIKGTPFIDDHFLDILDTFAKMPKYHSSKYREQAILELTGSFDTADLEKMIDEDPEGFKNSVDNFPAFEFNWLLRDFIKASKGTKSLENHFGNLIQFFEKSFPNFPNILEISAIFFELFEAIKDTELLKVHHSIMHKIFKVIKTPSQRDDRFELYQEAKEYFDIPKI